MSYKQQAGKGGTLFSFSLHLPDSFPSLLDDDGYLSFPNVSEANFLPESLQYYLPIRSPSLVPCFLFIFFFLLSASFSVPYALTLSFPLAMCLCYLEPKAVSLSASLDNDLSDSSDDEVCTSAQNTSYFVFSVSPKQCQNATILVPLSEPHLCLLATIWKFCPQATRVRHNISKLTLIMGVTMWHYDIIQCRNYILIDIKLLIRRVLSAE